jgi:hypothetical protein
MDKGKIATNVAIIAGILTIINILYNWNLNAKKSNATTK